VTSDQNAALVRRYFSECVNRLNGGDQVHALSVLDEILAADFAMAYNNEDPAKAERGPAAHKDFVIEHAQAYPEDAWTIEALVAHDETVACQWRITAKHAATGRSIDVRAADFFVIRNGRLAELRRFLDFADLRRQTRGSKVT
jgi:ketosteroid isomerase-like protein